MGHEAISTVCRLPLQWMACIGLGIALGSCVRGGPASPPSDAPADASPSPAPAPRSPDSSPATVDDERWLTDVLAHHSDPPSATAEREAIAHAFMEVVDQRMLDHEGVRWAPPEGLDDYRRRIRDDLLEHPVVQARLSVDIDDDGVPEHIIQVGAPNAWEQLLVVIDSPGDRAEVVLWDIISSRYGTPTLMVMSTASGPPPFGFPQLVGGTGTGYFSAFARFYQARGGPPRPVFEATASVSHVRGDDPSHWIKLSSRFDYSAKNGFQATYDVRIQWPETGFAYDGSLVVWFQWSEAGQRYSPDADLREADARRLHVIEQAFEVDHALTRAAFGG